ncbi:MAG: GTPase Era [Nitrospinae bacterium]|nr:GTPase Era [Nitrospinota bacterium]
MTENKKFGFVAIIGKPNAGKSTLLNSLIKYNLSITSNRPQTTRNSIKGILTENNYQVVFIDTPGFISKQKNKIDSYLNRNITDAIDSVEAIIYIADVVKLTKAEEQLDEIETIKNLNLSVPLIIVLNKIDLIKDKRLLLPITSEITKTNPNSQVYFTSALNNIETENLLKGVVALLPNNEFMFPEDTLTDVPEKFIACEFIREKIFRLTSQEIPYHSAVKMVEWKETDKLLRVYAEILITKESQKKVIIGKGGAKIKEIGTAARQKMESFFAIKVYLELRVKVVKKWRDDDAILRETSFLIE